MDAIRTTTPDGLTVHELPGVGLVVSAREHNRTLAELARANADVNRYRHALDQIGFRMAGTPFDSVSRRVIAVLGHKREPFNDLYDSTRLY